MANQNIRVVPEGKRHKWIFNKKKTLKNGVFTTEIFTCESCGKLKIVDDNNFKRVITYADEKDVLHTTRTPLCFKPGEMFSIETRITNNDTEYIGKGQYIIHRTVDGWLSCNVDEIKMSALRNGKINLLDLNFE